MKLVFLQSGLASSAVPEVFPEENSWEEIESALDKALDTTAEILTALNADRDAVSEAIRSNL